MDTDSSLTVVIISPTHSPHRFTLDLACKSTILQLKDLIAIRLQNGADTLLTATDQRLIYGGRILEDSETLDSIFEKVDCSNAPTIHLVVSQRHVSGSGQQQHQRTSAPGTPSPLRFRMQSDREHSTSTGSGNQNGNNTVATSATNLNASLFTPMTRSSSEPLSALPFQATVSGTATSAAAQPKQATASPPQFAPSLLPLQHVLVNGMPYLVPATYMPMLHLQQQIQLNALHPYLGPSMATNMDGTIYYQHIPPHYMANLGAAGVGPAHLGHGNGHGLAAAQAAGQAGGAAALAGGGRELNARDQAVRDQRRAASLWLFLKLAFGVYLFSQNGSIERIVLLNIAALIIFLHQTGRLRIVRRIVHQPGDQAQAGYNPAAPGGAVPPPPQAASASAQHQTTTSTSTSTSTSSSTPSVPTSSLQNKLNENSNNSSTPYAGSSSANTTGSNDTQLSSNSSPSSFSKTANMSQSNDGSTPSTNGQVQEATDGNHAEQQQQQQQQPEQHQPRMSTWRSIEYALLTFITSLVPAPPPEIDPAVANAAAAGERGM